MFYRLRAEQKRLEQMGMVPQQNVKLLASRLDVREKDIQEMDQRLSQSDLSLERAHHCRRETGSPPVAQPIRRSLSIRRWATPSKAEIFKRILHQFADTLEGT